jgi:hypothetical protein
MPEIPPALSAALGGRYRLDRVIGRGGMATVYLAKDLRHRRQVGVKVLKPELAASLGTERFLKEIEIAAGLTHPHIVPLYDSGRIGESPGGEPEAQSSDPSITRSDEHLYYVMPFIAGGSLRTRLRADDPFTVADVLALVTPVSDALAYAHRRGIVHRDIKPENILFAEGHPLVADFGIARAISTAGGVSLTRTGFGLGTPGYMSPEQAAGVKDLGPATDIFSLGCVAYEMLVGETPGLWLTDDAVHLGRFVDAEAVHRERLDRISGSVEQVLVRAVALRPEHRFDSPVAFADALRAAMDRRERFSDREVQRIIGRAAEIQLGAPDPDGDEALSIGAVEQVGAEVGIPPAQVREAVRELARPTGAGSVEAGGGRWFLGRATRVLVDRVVPTAVREAEFPFLADEIRTAMGSVGLVGTLGPSMTWSTSPPGQGTGRNVQITITARGDETRIHLEEHFDNLAGGLFGGILGGGGSAGTAAWMTFAFESLHLPLVAVLGGVSVLTGAYSLARTIYTRAYAKRRRQLEALADRLTASIEESGRERLAPGRGPHRLRS